MRFRWLSALRGGEHSQFDFAICRRRFPAGPLARDAILQASDCLEEAIAGRISDGLEIPLPSRPRRSEVLVTLSATLAAKAALYVAIRESGLPNTQAAKRLGVDEKEIRRMLDPRHATQLARIQRALAILGQRLVITVEEAA